MLTRPCRRCNGTAVERDEFATGQELRAKRKQAGKSLSCVAKKIGLHLSYLSMLELGRRDWNERLIAQYQDALK